MAARHALVASERTILGKEVSKIRKQGLTPGIVYGPAVADPIPVSVDTRELQRLHRGLGASTLIDIQIDGTTHVAYMRQVEIDRLARRLLHVEFFAPNLRVPITASVPVVFIGEPAIEGGVLAHGHDSLQLHGLPEQLPAMVEVDLAQLTEYEQSLYVRDAVIPAEVELVTDPEGLLVKLAAPEGQDVEELEAEVAAEAVPEAAEGAAEDSDAATEES